MRAILLLLYGAGLRVSEALALTLEDVDLSDAVITIRDTKFNKTRLVPLGLELNQVMVQYAASRNKAGHAQTGTAPFFVLRRGGSIPVQLVEQRFKCLREHAGVSRADGARYQPRLMTFVRMPTPRLCRILFKYIGWRLGPCSHSA